MKSWRDGPALRRSRKVVGERRVVEVGGAVGSVGSETAVANARDWCGEGRAVGRGGVKRQRNLVAFEAISRRFEEVVSCET